MRKLYGLPQATRPTPGMSPGLFGQFAEDLKRTALGEQIFGDAVMALTMACGEMNDIADAEDNIIKAENERIANGGDPVAVRMHEGRARAMPTRYDELAEVAESRLDRAITDHEARIAKHTRTQINILEKMEDLLVHPETARDTQLQAQIRDHMKSLGKHKSKGFAMTSAMDGDRAALHTIFLPHLTFLGLQTRTLVKSDPLPKKC